VSEALGDNSGLFHKCPPLGLQRQVGLIEPGRPHTIRRAILVVVAGWAPLALLTLLHTATGYGSSIGWFLSDAAVHARSLIAAPLFILAEAACTSRLDRIAQHFRDAGFVAEEDRPRFDAAVNSTVGLLASSATEAATVILAYAIVLCLILSVATSDIPLWHQGDFAKHSLAGWWHLLVSLPILLMLILGWAFRLMLWTRFLWLTSRFDLRLVPAHPDHAAGLQFAGSSVRAFSAVALPLAVIAAGWVANGILRGGATPFAYDYFVAGFTALAVGLFTAPLLVFSGKLMRERRRGVFEYGSLASQLGRQFEQRWLIRRQPIDDGILEAPDFSAVTDLYQVAANVYEMRLMAIDLKSVLILVGSILLPFAVVAVISLPHDEILSQIVKLLL
jgi:hypothetical protein